MTRTRIIDDLWRELARLAAIYPDFSDAVRDLASGKHKLPTTPKRGQPRVRTEVVFRAVWLAVEMRRQGGLSVNSACASIARKRKAGIRVRKVTRGKRRERTWTKAQTLRGLYYEADRAREADPALKADWDDRLTDLIEGRRTGQSLFEVVIGEHKSDPPP